MEEKGWLFHYACVLLGTDSEMCSKGIMRSVMKLWGLKVVDVPLYLPNHSTADLFTQECSAHYYFLEINVLPGREGQIIIFKYSVAKSTQVHICKFSP